MVLGSIFFLFIQIQTIPIKAAKAITNNELAELFTPLGSKCKPATESFKLLAANKLNDPPLCSKKAQKKIENKIKYYERVSPSAEKLDQLMILYGGFIGLLAFKLNKPFSIARSILKYRGKYRAWLKYNYYLGRGGKPRELIIKEID